MTKKKLFQALAEAQKSLSAIGKDGDGPRGAYVSVDSAVAASKAALAMHGLALIQTSLRLEELAAVPIEEGHGDEVSFKRRLVLKREMVLVHTESGEAQSIDQTWPINMYGSREKSIDHAVAAADSFGLTYLLRGLLLFPRGDEHDTTDRVNDHNRDNHGARTYDNYQRDDTGQVVDVKATVTRSTNDVIDYAAMLLTGKLSKSACEAVKRGEKPFTCKAETLAKQGWTKLPNPEDMAAVGDGLIPDPLKKDLWKSAVAISGDAKVKGIWGALVPTGQNPSGYQALVIATLCMNNPK